MKQLDRDHYINQPETPDVRPVPETKPLRVGLRRFSRLFFTILLLTVLGIGLFAGWVCGTRSTSLNPTGTSTALLNPSTSGSTLDTLRETIIEQVRPAVVQVNVVTRSEAGLGSGVIIDPRGYLVTNAHVIAEAQQIQVTLFDGTSLPAYLVGSDPLDDLAVLKIASPKKLTTLPLGDSSKLRVGQEVLVIGNPLGITQSVTDGIISALNRAVSSIPDAFQTDAAINPGNSGGALVNLQGELVGIPTFSAIDPQFQTPANGVGFAIPSNRVQLIATQVIETGKVPIPDGQ